VKGRTLAEAEQLFGEFHRMVTAPSDEGPDVGHLGKLSVFAGVREFPVRVKCASLPWHTLRAAVKAEETSVSTE
jgi:nitrogen fixation NifU-like protein